MQYSKELKNATLKRVLPPDQEPISKVAKELGISEQTIRNWVKEAGVSGMENLSGEESAQRWTSKDKFNIVVETLGLNEIELAEYARKKGIFTDDIHLWRDACMNANDGTAKEISKLNKKLKDVEKEKKELAKELEVKTKALAETAALLVLRKKAQSIWGALAEG